MPVLKDFNIRIDSFAIWEAFQGINGGYTIDQFKNKDNFYIWQQILVLAATIAGIDTSEEGIIAFAAGGQAGARQLTEDYNKVDTVAAPAASVKLDSAIKNKKRVVLNNGANDMEIFPSLGENFLGLAADTPVSISPTSSLEVFSFANGIWVVI